MRNGNLGVEKTTWYRWLVLILPMRNGNFFSHERIPEITNSSYPTYEEWKHGISSSNKL